MVEMGAIMQAGPHVTCPLFLFDSNQNGKASTNVSTDGGGVGVVQGFSSCHVHTQILKRRSA